MKQSLSKHISCKYLSTVFENVSIHLRTMSKFQIDSIEERIGFMFRGFVLWWQLGQASKVINSKSKKEFHCHLNHEHGLPFKDFAYNIPCASLQTGIAGGAVDEKVNEACFGFQHLTEQRQQFKTRTPYVNLYQLMNLRPIEKSMCRIYKWKGRKYFDDTRFVMTAIEIDTSTFYNDVSMGTELLKLISLLNGVLTEQHYDLFSYLTFYNEGSIRINCDMLFIEEGIRQPTTLVSTSQSAFALGASVCKYDEWKNVVEAIVQEVGAPAPRDH